MPKRIRLSRAKGWRKPPGAIVCSRPSKWGNPYDWRKIGKAEAKARYYADLQAGRLAITKDDARRELRGHDLCCWCGLDDFCHVDVLLFIANYP